MAMVRVGQRVTEFFHLGRPEICRKKGRVVYVHPERRFYVVEFRLGTKKRFSNTVREPVIGDDGFMRDPDGIYVRESYFCDPEDRMKGAMRRWVS